MLQGLATTVAADANRQSDMPICSSPPLSDISFSDLSPLVLLRRNHQTRQAKIGIRTWDSSTIETSRGTAVKELSDRQKLSRRMQSIVRIDQERGSSTGLNRATRWIENNSKPMTLVSDVLKILPQEATPDASGNSANAALAARGRAQEVYWRLLLITMSPTDEFSR